MYIYYTRFLIVINKWYNSKFLAVFFGRKGENYLLVSFEEKYKVVTFRTPSPFYRFRV